MNWLTKILKKEKKNRKENEVKEKVIPEEMTTKIKTIQVESANTSRKFDQSRRFDQSILLAHHLTEKTAGGGKNDKHAFRVSPRANKVLVKSAVEGRFGVRVKSVNMVNTPGKERKRGRQIGFKPGFKKAIVALESGQSIEVA